MVQMQAEQVRVFIRWMIRRDMNEVMEIERASFDRPWTEEEFLRVLRMRHCIGMVAEISDRVLGYMIYEMHKDRLNVIAFAVHPGFRRSGIGRQMVDKLAGKLSGHRRTALEVMVRETNLPAQLFFRDMAFRAVEVARNAYPDTGEDAFKMLYTLDDPRDR